MICLCIINKVMTSKIPTIEVMDDMPSFERNQKIKATGKRAIWVLLLPLLILVGIYSGACTPTEAAAIAMVYALLIGIFIYRSINLNILWSTLCEGGKLTGSIVMVFFFFFVLSPHPCYAKRPRCVVKVSAKYFDNHIIILLYLTYCCSLLACLWMTHPD